MFTGFKTVDFRVITDFMQFKLLEDVDFFAKDGTHYVLPAMAPSDLASTPPEVWGAPLFLPPSGWYGPAVYGHDCAYQNTLLIVDADGTRRKATLTQIQSDAFLLEMMQSLKPNATAFERAQMQGIFEGVSIGGWHAFKEDRTG